MYKFDKKTDPNARYFGYEYNHYLIADLKPYNADAACLEILDPEKTLEEKLAAQKKFTDLHTDMWPKLDPEIDAQLEIREIYAPGLEKSDPDVRMLILTPKVLKKKKNPTALMCHSGGMIMGNPENQLWEAADYAINCSCIVIMPQYRLLPKYRYPAAVNDIEAAVNYILAHQDELRVNPKRMIVTGCSSGGYLAACIAQRLKFRGDYQFAGELLVYPVIDDYFSYPSSNVWAGDTWGPNDDQRVFAELLGPDYVRSTAPWDAIPSHCTDFKGLPPTVIFTGELDYGHDPCIAYGQGIMNANIFCSIFSFGGCWHGYAGLGLGTEIGERAFRMIREWMGDLLTGKCVRNYDEQKKE